MASLLQNSEICQMRQKIIFKKVCSEAERKFMSAWYMATFVTVSTRFKIFTITLSYGHIFIVSSLVEYLLYFGSKKKTPIVLRWHLSIHQTVFHFRKSITSWNEPIHIAIHIKYLLNNLCKRIHNYFFSPKRSVFVLE